MHTVLGFDFGLHKIGLAIGQRVTGTARALLTLASRGGSPDWDAIAHAIEHWQPEALVVGVPFHLDGTEHELTRASRRFARRLQERFHLPVHCVDERLSSEAAREHLREARAQRDRKVTLDAIAARLLVEQWLHQAGPE